MTEAELEKYVWRPWGPFGFHYGDPNDPDKPRGTMMLAPDDKVFRCDVQCDRDPQVHPVREQFDGALAIQAKAWVMLQVAMWDETRKAHDAAKMLGSQVRAPAES